MTHRADAWQRTVKHTFSNWARDRYTARRLLETTSAPLPERYCHLIPRDGGLLRSSGGMTASSYKSASDESGNFARASKMAWAVCSILAACSGVQKRLSHGLESSNDDSFLGRTNGKLL